MNKLSYHFPDPSKCFKSQTGKLFSKLNLFVSVFGINVVCEYKVEFKNFSCSFI